MSDPFPCKTRTKLLKDLDKSVTFLMLKMETQTCSAKLNVMWSPVIWTSHCMINYWILKLKAKRHWIDASDQLTGIPDKFKLIIDNPTTGIFTSHSARRKSISNHWSRSNGSCGRNILQVSQSRQMGLQKTEGELTALKVIQSRESMQKNYAYLRWVFRPACSAGISSIEIPNAISNPREVEQLLLEQNVKHCSQARDT